MLDLEKAFELADPTSITAILAEKGVHGKLLGGSRTTLDRSTSVSFQGHSSRTRAHLRMESSPLSILVEQLIQLPFQAGTKLFTYADDLQLVSIGQHRYAHTEHALDIICRECNRTGLKINPAKSSAIYTSGEHPGPSLTI